MKEKGEKYGVQKTEEKCGVMSVDKEYATNNVMHRAKNE
jgi:hypothetical protein